MTTASNISSASLIFPSVSMPTEAEWDDFTPIPLDAVAIQRILVCQLRQIGDVLLSTPSISLLAQRFPKAEIHVLTEKKCVPMLENNPAIHRIWPIDKQELSTIGKQLRFYRLVARQGFDLVVGFQQLPRCQWVAGMSRAPIRLSFASPWYKSWMYTHTVRQLDGYAGMAKASVLRPLGIRWRGETPRLYLTEEEREFATDFLARYGVESEHRLVTVDATHRRSARCWPARHYGKLLSLAARAMPDLRFHLLYGPGERDAAKAVRDACDCPQAIILPDEQTTLRQVAACIERAVFHVGNCSAPRHMAVAVGTPTLTMLGASSPAWCFPSPSHTQVALGLPCQPCNRATCSRGDECLEGLSPDAVWQVMQTHMQRCGLL